uniref:Uncharacterized protein n=1 Tax=Arundo donax TaxID=35708 RepID=A0A0A9FZ14_ARUDO
MTMYVMGVLMFLIPYMSVEFSLLGFYAVSCFLNRASGTLKTVWMIGSMNS